MSTAETDWGGVLEKLGMSPLPPDFRPQQMFLICKAEVTEDGEVGSTWVTRASDEFNREEFLGALLAYLEHVKQELASEWAN